MGWFRVFGCSRLAEARCRKSLLWRHSRKQTSAYDVKAERQENMQGDIFSESKSFDSNYASLCWILCTLHLIEHHLFICPCSSIFTYIWYWLTYSLLFRVIDRQEIQYRQEIQDRQELQVRQEKHDLHLNLTFRDDCVGQVLQYLCFLFSFIFTTVFTLTFWF